MTRTKRLAEVIRDGSSTIYNGPERSKWFDGNTPLARTLEELFKNTVVSLAASEHFQ